MTTRYIIAFLASIIIMVGGLLGYGVYVNVSSDAHVAKLASAQYSRVTGSRVVYRELAPMISLPSVFLHSSWMLDVHVKLEGTVAQLYVNTGDQVRAGQLLGNIVNDELPAQVLQAEGKIDEARANLVKCENTLNRYQNLVHVGGVSRQQLDEAVASQAAASAQVMSAVAYRDQLNTRLGGQQIIAPRDGDILKVYVKAGTFIRAGESLVMIGDFSDLLIRENLPDETLEKLLIQGSRFKLVLRANQPLDKAYEANLRRDNPGAEKSFVLRMSKVEPPLTVPAKYRSVVWNVENPSGELEPGNYYQVKIYGEKKRRLLTVPKEAVSGNREANVLIVLPDNRLEERTVQIGIQDDEYLEINAGLQEGDVVVLSGRSGLMPGMKVQVTLDAGREK